MTIIRSSSPRNLAEWEAALSQDLLSDDAPENAEIWRLAGLTNEEIAVVEKYSSQILRVIRNRWKMWTVFGTRGMLKRLARLLSVYDGPQVASPKKVKFLSDMFGKHAMPVTRRIDDTTLAVGTPSGELHDSLFELELICMFVSAGYQISLKPKITVANGARTRVPEFRAYSDSATVLVEAKNIHTLHIVYSHADARMGSFQLTTDQERRVTANILNNLRKARSEFCDIDEPHMIFIRSTVFTPHSCVESAMNDLRRDEEVTENPNPVDSDTNLSGIIFVIPIDVIAFRGNAAKKPWDTILDAASLRRLIT